MSTKQADRPHRIAWGQSSTWRSLVPVPAAVLDAGRNAPPGHGQLHEVARAHLVGPAHDGPVEAANDGKTPLDHVLGGQGTGMDAQRFGPAPGGLELRRHRPAPVTVVKAPLGRLQVGARMGPLQAVPGVP